MNRPCRFTFLALGDSYTAGEGVPRQEGWPFQLVRLLRGRDIPLEDPMVMARTGWTTGELLEALRDLAPALPFSLVTLLIGVNNQYRGLPLDDYRRDFRRLLEKAMGWTEEGRGRLLVLSIPDWGASPFGRGRDRERIAREVDAFNEVNRREAEAAGAAYADVTGVSRAVGDNPTFFAEDGLHPSGAQYRLWVEALLPQVAVWFGGGCG